MEIGKQICQHLMHTGNAVENKTYILLEIQWVSVIIQTEVFGLDYENTK